MDAVISVSEAVGASRLVAPFCLVSDECIRRIADFLEWKDLSSLWLTGNGALHSKLHRSVEKIEVELFALQKYPISAFQYPRLRSFKVTCLLGARVGACYMPYLVQDDLLVPVEGHQSLETLEIEGSLAMTLLHASAARPSLSELLPRLRTLRLAGGGYFNHGCLKNVPRTLTELEISHALPSNVPTLPYIYVDALRDLPRSLTKLTLGRLPIKLGEPRNTVEYLPPSLTHLNISCASLEFIFLIIPSAIQNLSITLIQERRTMQEILQTSCLERFEQLSSFCLIQETGLELTLVPDKPFPASLTLLRLPLDYAHLRQKEPPFPSTVWRSILPRSLTSFHGFNSFHTSIDLPSTLPHLIHAHIDPQSLATDDLPKIWPPLAFIELPNWLYSDECIRALPHTLIKLTALIEDNPVWLEKLSNMKQLSALTLLDNGDLHPPKGLWSIAHEQLIAIRFNIKHCTSIEDVCGDWKKLEEIHFVVPDERGICQAIKDELRQYTTTPSSSGLKLFRYPTTLRTFTSNIGARASFFSHSLEYLTLLKSVTVACPVLPSIGLPETEAAIEVLFRLPDSVTSLNVNVYQDLPPRYLWSLPKSLKLLNIFVFHMDFVWEADHIRSLPDNLVHAALIGDYSMISLEASTLPKVMSHLYLADSVKDLNTLAFVETRRQRLVGKPEEPKAP